MKFIELKYIYAMRIARAIKVFHDFGMVDGFPDDQSGLVLTYHAAQRAWMENEDNDQFFMIPLPDDKEDANLLCRALKMYTASEAIFWNYGLDMKEGMEISNSRLCERILARYE